MSIASRMRQNIQILREMIERDNGDIVNGGKSILDAMEAEISRVTELETYVLLVKTYGKPHPENKEGQDASND